MKTILAVPVLFFGLISVCQAEDAVFEIYQTPGSNGECHITAENKTAGPYTASVNVGRGRFQPGQKWPLHIVLPPVSTVAIARVVADGRVTPCDVDLTYTSSIGDAVAIPKYLYHYVVPFATGSRASITQWASGYQTTHQGALTRNAVDFNIRRGTPVVAARAGVVVEVRDRLYPIDRNRRAGAEADFVSIVHDDGTIAQYSRMEPGKVTVAVGDRVEVGDVIGKAGRVSPGLHLDIRHAVFKRNGKVTQESIPFFLHSRAGDRLRLRFKKPFIIN